MVGYNINFLKTFRIMVNCLETRLKASVNNDSLTKLGELVIHVTEGSVSNEASFIITHSNSVKVTPKNGGKIGLANNALSTDPITLTSGATTTIYVENKTFDITVEDKYNILRLYLGNNSESLCTINVNDLAYTNLLTLKIIGACTGSINNVKTNQIYISSNTIDGNLDLFETVPNGILNIWKFTGIKISGNINKLTSATVGTIDIFNTSISGDISSLSENIAMTTLSVRYSRVGGTVESLINAMRVNRSTGILIIRAEKSSVTYKDLGFTIVKYNFATNEYFDLTR